MFIKTYSGGKWLISHFPPTFAIIIHIPASLYLTSPLPRIWRPASPPHSSPRPILDVPKSFVSRFQVSKFPNTRPNVPVPFSPSLFYTQPYILSRYVSISRSSTQFFQVNVKSQWTHPLQWEIILIYWLCRRILQPFVWWGNTQRLRFLIIFSFC